MIHLRCELRIISLPPLNSLEKPVLVEIYYYVNDTELRAVYYGSIRKFLLSIERAAKAAPPSTAPISVKERELPGISNLCERSIQPPVSANPVTKVKAARFAGLISLKYSAICMDRL